jgi:hypothetical protein
MTAPSSPPGLATEQARTRSTIARALTISAVVMLVIAVVLGIAVHPALFGLALIALADYVLGRMFASGRLGAGSVEPGEDAALAEADANYNPYARED